MTRSSYTRFFFGMCLSCGILSVLLLLDKRTSRHEDTNPLKTFPEQQIKALKKEYQPSSNKFLNISNFFLPRSDSSNSSATNHLLTVDPFGRMGNNMFQYAGLLGLAKANKRTPFVLPTFSLTKSFGITKIKQVDHPEKWRPLIYESHFATYDKTLNFLPPGKNLMIQAYLQSYKYFENIRDLIRSEFRFLRHINRNAGTIILRLLSTYNYSQKPVVGNLTLIGVHVRRGDRLLKQEVNKGDRTPSDSYFKGAFNWMRKKYRNVLFLVASDDPQWVSSHITAKDVIILPPDNADVHLCVLSKCSHTIMSVGTFGWWAGFLAGGDVIYYNQPIAAKSIKSEQFSMEDHYPKHWTPLG